MVSRMATSYRPQVVQVNEELAQESTLDLMLTQDPHDENPNRKRCALVLKSIPFELSIIAFS